MKPLVFGLLIISLQSFGQLKYSPGYVVLNNGDTLKGFVMDEEWLYSPQRVNFKQSETSSQTTYSVKDIRAMASPYNTYQRYIVAYDPDDLRARFLPRTRDPKYVSDTLLLKLLYKSTYSLLKTTTNNGRAHFFLAADTFKTSGPHIEELLYREWIRPDGNEMMMTNEKWKQQLINLTISCGGQLTNQIKESRYDEKELTKLMDAVNGCKGGVIYQRPPRPELARKRSKVGIVGSGFLYNLQTRSGRSKFDKLHPALGVSYERFSKKWPEKFAYYHELKYSTLEQQGKTQDYALPANYDVQAIRLLTLLRFYIPNDKAAFFATGGISNGIPIKSRGWIEETQFTARVEFSKFEKLRLEQGFVLGIGVTLFPSAPVSLILESRYQVEIALSKTEFRDAKSLNFVAALQF